MTSHHIANPLHHNLHDVCVHLLEANTVLRSSLQKVVQSRDLTGSKDVS